MATTVLRRTAGQLFMVGLPRPGLDRETREFLAEHCPGGVILFKRNIRSAEQLRRLVADIHATGAGVPPLVALDHEGGRVDRLPHPPFTHFPPMAVVAERGKTALAEAVGHAMGRELPATELLPFARAAAAGIPALMPAHVVVPALDPRRPATVSPAICRDLLRRRLRFRGVLFSDDLEMQAMAGRRRVGRAAVEALLAGCDMLLVCQSLAAAREAMAAVEDALGRGTLDAGATAASLSRIQGLRRRLTAPPGRASFGWPAHERLAR